MDVVTLSRIQFGLNISFHYIFPPLSIGLGLLMVLMEGMYLWTKNPIYETMTKFWVKIFAIIFAVGVGTGLVQVFGFGTNWSAFSRYVGDVFGSILGAEGIFAFFLESGFLAILLFGWDRCSPKMHFFATVMVTFGAHFSGVWIVIANSWMQTPAGHAVVGEGVTRHAIMESWWGVINNPSSMDRLVHVLLGAWLSGTFLVLSISSFYLLRNRHLDFAKRCFKISLIVATISVILQGLSGDSTARGVAENQPIKLAAFEGVYRTETPTPIWVYGIVDSKERKVTGFSIPGLLSFLVFHNFTQPIPGLDQYPAELWPNVKIVFQTYHGMIFMWGLMVIGVLVGWLAWRSKDISKNKWTLRYLIISVLFPQIGNQLGWYSAEMGRQPWVVQGLMRTSEGVSPNLIPEQVIFSIVMFSLIYILVFALFIYLLDLKIKHGPATSPEIYEYRNPYEVSNDHPL